MTTQFKTAAEMALQTERSKITLDVFRKGLINRIDHAAANGEHYITAYFSSKFAFDKEAFESLSRELECLGYSIHQDLAWDSFDIRW